MEIMEIIVFGLALAIFSSLACQNFALSKRKSIALAGIIGFIFGLLGVLYYWSYPDPIKMHQLYPDGYNEHGETEKDVKKREETDEYIRKYRERHESTSNKQTS